jgi:RNA polymerase sigma-70 factor (ECF subfamily)
VRAGDAGRSPAAGGRGKLDDVHAAEITALYKAEMPRLVLFVMTISRVIDGHAAQDIAHTAFERAMPRWPYLRHPKTWLYKVAQREAVARAEAISREVPADAVPDRPDPISAALTAEWRDEQRHVMELLRQLAPKQRLVMTWTLAGFSDAEIADALGITADAVRQNRREARKNLSKQLGTRKETS